VLLIIVGLMISILYWVAPNAKRGFQWVSPGGVLSVVVWLIASGLFAFYVANFANYNKTYGSIAGVIIFLVWLWISNMAILFGAEFNAELEVAAPWLWPPEPGLPVPAARAQGAQAHAAFSCAPGPG
jgi:membrane protein